MLWGSSSSVNVLLFTFCLASFCDFVSIMIARIFVDLFFFFGKLVSSYNG